MAYFHSRVALAVLSACLLFQQMTALVLDPTKDYRNFTTARIFSKPRKAAWFYTVALKDIHNEYAKTGLTISITSLIDSGTEYPVIVIVDGEVDKFWYDFFAALGVERVLHVQKDFPELHEELPALNEANNRAQEKYWGCFNKLLGWALTDYDKVISLDFDTVWWQNPDDAMMFPEVSAINDPGMSLGNPNPDWAKPFQASIIVMQPSMTTAHAILQHLKHHVDNNIDTGDLPEQHILNEFWNLRWFDLPFGFNIMPSQIAYEAYRGVYSIHHVAWWKDLFYRAADDKCTDNTDCAECCRRAVAARVKGEEKLRKARLRDGRREHHRPHREKGEDGGRRLQQG